MAPQIYVFIFMLTLLLGIASATDVLRAARFGYSGNNGPDKWGNLDPTFTACSSGKRQSPVNILKNLTVHNKQLKPLTRNYKRSINATLVNNGFNIGLRLEEYGGEVSIDGKNYVLSQMHWHLPSEHHINGEQFAAELHLVHRAPDNRIAVIALLYQEKHADPFIAKIMNGLNELSKEKYKANKLAAIPIGTLATKQLKRSCRKYYRYVGSLTTPPCSENVTWSIMGKVRSISKEQIAALDTPLNSNCKKNARPCQPLNGRKIEMYAELIA